MISPSSSLAAGGNVTLIRRPVAILLYRGDTVAMAVTAVWWASAPAVPLKVATAAANQDVCNKADDHSARLLGVDALLAVVIGCVGL